MFLSSIKNWELIYTLVLIFDGDVISVVELASEDALHHQNQLIVGDGVVVDGNATNVVVELSLKCMRVIRLRQMFLGAGQRSEILTLMINFPDKSIIRAGF